jgi:hypothetical protein
MQILASSTFLLTFKLPNRPPSFRLRLEDLDRPPNNAPTAVAMVGCGASGLRYVKLKCNLEIDGAAGFAKPRKRCFCARYPRNVSLESSIPRFPPHR